MEISQGQVLEVVSTVWSTALDLPLERWRADAAPPGPDGGAAGTGNENREARRLPASADRNITASVQLAFSNGVAIVELMCSTEFGRRAAGRMFELPPDRATLAEVMDAVGELVNIIGGNVKTIAAGAMHLSLPAVTEGRDYTSTIRGGELTHELAFVSDGEPVVLRLSRQVRQSS